jgi:hypothetical protein
MYLAVRQGDCSCCSMALWPVSIAAMFAPKRDAAAATSELKRNVTVFVAGGCTYSTQQYSHSNVCSPHSIGHPAPPPLHRRLCQPADTSFGMEWSCTCDADCFGTIAPAAAIAVIRAAPYAIEWLTAKTS